MIHRLSVIIILNTMWFLHDDQFRMSEELDEGLANLTPEKIEEARDILSLFDKDGDFTIAISDIPWVYNCCKCLSPVFVFRLIQARKLQTHNCPKCSVMVFKNQLSKIHKTLASSFCKKQCSKILLNAFRIQKKNDSENFEWEIAENTNLKLLQL